MDFSSNQAQENNMFVSIFSTSDEDIQNSPLSAVTSDMADDNFTNSSDGQNELDEFELWNEFETFRRIWQTLIDVYVPLEIFVMCLGLMGNLLALTTLIRSRNLCTPSFAYHRALVLADFVFCLNYFGNVFIDRFATVEVGQFQFSHYSSAYYSGVVYHVVHLTCTYVIHYMTVLIAVDRFVALLICKKYQAFNQASVAMTVVVVCVALAVVVHAWAPWVQREVIVYVSEEQSNKTGSFPITYTWIKRQNFSPTLRTLLKVKDIYNGVLRIAYPLLVSVLTVGVIYGFVRRQRHISVRYASATYAGRQRARYEKTLFFFMVAVVVLTFVEIVPSEGRRFLEMIYPPGEISSKHLTNWRLPLRDRLFYFRILLYGYQISRLMSNLFTAVNRSFLCYLYVVMNNLFRKELFALLCCCQPVQAAGLMRPRTVSQNTPSITNIVNSTVTIKQSPNKWISLRAFTKRGSPKNLSYV